MRTSFLISFTAVLICTLLVTLTEAATEKPNSFRTRARKRQFADNSQLVNVEQNGDILKLFSTTTNIDSNRGRTNSPNMNGKDAADANKPAAPGGLFGGLLGGGGGGIDNNPAGNLLSGLFGGGRRA